jgi:6-phosphogluconolactonase
MSELAPVTNTVRMVTVSRFVSVAELGRSGAETAARMLSKVLSVKPKATLAVPGGSTADCVLPQLASRSLPWDRVLVTLTDDRWVAPDHPDSNEGRVRALLRVADAKVAGLYIADVAPEEAVATLQREVPAPDVVLVGMGADGHIASLFPGDAANLSSLMFAAVKRPDHARVTLTPVALRAPAILVFSGEEKQNIFAQARSGRSTMALPVRHVLRPGTEVLIGP